MKVGEAAAPTAFNQPAKDVSPTVCPSCTTVLTHTLVFPQITSCSSRVTGVWRHLYSDFPSLFPTDRDSFEPTCQFKRNIQRRSATTKHKGLRMHNEKTQSFRITLVTPSSFRRGGGKYFLMERMNYPPTMHLAGQRGCAVSCCPAGSRCQIKFLQVH